MNKIAIIYTFDDKIVNYSGGSKSGIKKELSYFEQFLISYQSINENWNMDTFNYDFYIVHTDDFSEHNMNILNKLDVTLIKTNSLFGNVGKRIGAFSVDIECDFRLVLDNDTIALQTPDFDFSKDILVSYGGAIYPNNIYKSICEDILHIKTPSESTPQTSVVGFSDLEYANYYQSDTNKRLFPALNAGAIMINNSISYEFGNRLAKAVNMIPTFAKRFGGSSKKVIQPVYGLVVNDVTDNWHHFDKGFNILLSTFGRVKNVYQKYGGPIYLAHYIDHTNDDLIYKKIKYYKNKINNDLLVNRTTVTRKNNSLKTLS